MSRKTKTLIIALGILILLGGGYYGSTIWKKKKADADLSSRPAALKIGNLDAAKLVKIEAAGLVLEKKGDAWQLDSLNGTNPPAGLTLDQNSIQNLAASLATISIERLVDETTPADLSVYGLDKPSGRTVITDSDGKTAVYLVGNMAPSRSSYYIMQEGDPKVYTVSSYSAESMQITLDKVRNRTLFASFDTTALTRFRIESQDRRIDISAKPESMPPYLSSFINFIMTSPYKLPRGVESQVLDQVVAPLKNLAITDFINDSPSSLIPYGLDKPVRVFISANDASKNSHSMELLVGNRIDGKNYAKLADAPGVFTLTGLDAILNAKAFSLVDKFAMLINIDNAEQITVTGGEKELSAGIKGKGDDAVYSLNGKTIPEKSFKIFYQAIIGMQLEAEYPGPSARKAEDSDRNITIEFLLNNPAGARVSITLIPYNRDFYSVRQEGTMEFLISRDKIRDIYKTADEVANE